MLRLKNGTIYLDLRFTDDFGTPIDLSGKTVALAAENRRGERIDFSVVVQDSLGGVAVATYGPPIHQAAAPDLYRADIRITDDATGEVQYSETFRILIEGGIAR